MRLYVKLLAHSRYSNYSGLFFFFMYFTPTMSQKVQGWVRHTFCPPGASAWSGHVHACLRTVLGRKAMKAKSSGLECPRPREPVKDTERELDPIWRLIRSFLESSAYVRSGSLPADGGSQDVGLSPRNQSSPQSHWGQLSKWLIRCSSGTTVVSKLRALLQFRDTYISPSLPPAFRTVRNSWQDQGVLTKFSPILFVLLILW